MSVHGKFTGSLLGLALGDAIGAPFEGSYQGLKPDFRDYLPVVLRYTDDTEMAIGVAESLIDEKGFNADNMAMKFLENYDPFRGYGPGTASILVMLQNGMYWREANRRVFKDGSFGNGAAMRVAPLGLFFSHDAKLLREAVEEASSITHSHPLGMEGAVILAYAISRVLTMESEFDKEDFIEGLISFTHSEEYGKKLSVIENLLRTEVKPADIVDILGNSILAVESVPTAIYAFLQYGDVFIKTVEFCISLGGDTDTIGAMAGALSGCLIGERSLPRELVFRLEDGEKGRQYISRLAEELHNLHLLFREP